MAYIFPKQRSNFRAIIASVVDRLRFDADPDPNFHADADPDPNFHVDADPDPDWHQNNAGPQADPRYPKFHTCWKIRNCFNFSHSIATLQCFIFLISVKCDVCFQYFGQHIEISGKRSTLSTFSFSWNSYGIWIGMLLIPIPIRIRQNDADPT
jgi:hypothetical protein